MEDGNDEGKSGLAQPTPGQLLKTNKRLYPCETNSLT